MATESFLAPTRRKLIVLAVVVALQLAAAAVGLGCGWALIHGAQVVLSGACLAAAGFLLLPSALLSTGYLPRLPIPYAVFSVLTLALNALWAWMLACAVSRFLARWRRTSR